MPHDAMPCHALLKAISYFVFDTSLCCCRCYADARCIRRRADAFLRAIRAFMPRCRRRLRLIILLSRYSRHYCYFSYLPYRFFIYTLIFLLCLFVALRFIDTFYDLRRCRDTCLFAYAAGVERDAAD